MIIAILVLNIINFVCAAIPAYIKEGRIAINIPSIITIVLTIIMLATNNY